MGTSFHTARSKASVNRSLQKLKTSVRTSFAAGFTSEVSPAAKWKFSL